MVYLQASFCLFYLPKNLNRRGMRYCTIALPIIPVIIPTINEREKRKKLIFFAHCIFEESKKSFSNRSIRSETSYHFSKASSMSFFPSNSLAVFAMLIISFLLHNNEGKKLPLSIKRKSALNLIFCCNLYYDTLVSI